MNITYILQCADGSFYSGWTNQLTKRMAAHNFSDRGAKYTRTRRPVMLAYCEAFATQGEAMRREAALKKWSHAQKRALIQSLQETDEELLTVYDAGLRPCGTLPRRVAHRCGLRHQVAHLLAVEARAGKPGVWLQQRAADRPLLPGRYDWTASGHISAGESAVQAVLREAWEEAGLTLRPDRLEWVGAFRGQGRWREMVNGAPCEMLDDEVAQTYVYRTGEALPCAPGSEVARMVWAAADALTRTFRDGRDLPVTNQDGGQEQIAARDICCAAAQWQKARALLREKG